MYLVLSLTKQTNKKPLGSECVLSVVLLRRLTLLSVTLCCAQSCHMAFRASPLIRIISMATLRWIKADRFPHTVFISTCWAFKQLTDCTVTSNCSHLSIHQTRPSACMIQIHTLIMHTGVRQRRGTEGEKHSHPLRKQVKFLTLFS